MKTRRTILPLVFLVFLVFLVLLLMLLFFIINGTTQRFTNNSMDQLLVLTYDNNVNEPNVQTLLKLLDKNKYKYKILGNGENWNGWYGRLNSYIKFMETLNPDTYLVLCDARDVLVTENSETFITKAKKEYKNKLIFSTEPNCCTLLDGENKQNYISEKNKDMNLENALSIYKEYMKSKALEISGQDYYYSLNFGLQFGKVKDFLNVFKMMNIQPGQDDQTLAYKIFYDHPELVELDYKNVLFSNTHTLKINFSEDYNFDNNIKKWVVTRTGTTPSFIQTPSKYWEAYYLLLEKISI